MSPFYGWGSTASRLQPLRGGSLLFTIQFPGNYRPITVLPCFSKVLEKIMYNRLYIHLSENNLLYKKQFGFQQKHSTEHAIIQLIDQI